MERVLHELSLRGPATVQRWYGTTVASSRWILLDRQIHWDPTVGCNGDTVPLLHHNFLLV